MQIKKAGPFSIWHPDQGTLMLWIFFYQCISVADLHGKTALHHSAAGGHLQATSRLLDGHVDINGQNNDGQAALHLASAAGHKAIVSKLLENNAKGEATDNKGQTALHIAIKHGKLNVIPDLIKNGAKAMTKDSDGMSPLAIAREGQYEDVIYMLENSVSQYEKFKRQNQPFLKIGDDLVRDYFESQLAKDTIVVPLTRLKKEKGVGLVHNTGEAKLLANQVDRFVGDIISEIKKENVFFRELGIKQKLLVGSNAEKSKVSAPDAFDYAVVFTVKGAPPIVQYKFSGYAELLLPYLSSYEFHTRFWKALSLILQDPRFTKLHTGRLRLTANEDYGYLDGKICCTLKLRWHGVQFRDLPIALDLVPTIEIEEPCNFLAQSSHAEGYFLVPRPPQRDSLLGGSMDEEDLNKLWRVTFSETETQMIHNFPQPLEDAFVTCKCVRSLVPNLKTPTQEDTLHVGKFVSGYMLKVICLREREALHNCGSLENTVDQVFSTLVCYLEREDVPNYWNFKDGADNIMKSSKQKTKDCLIVAKLLHAIVCKLVQHENKIEDVTNAKGYCTWADLTDTSN